MKSQTEIYQTIENKIIERLERGIIPWQKPFDINNSPVNRKTGKHYSGVNEWLLQLFYPGDPIFVGFKQAQALGGHIKKGQSGLPIMFPIIRYYDRNTGKQISRSKAETMAEANFNQEVYYSYSYVWNISQTEGINREVLPSLTGREKLDFNPIGQCENLLESWDGCPEIRRGGSRAFYHTGEDYINIPESQYFCSEQEVYATIFHEIIHATGSAGRLDRSPHETCGNIKYSFEELVAELGSAYLCGFAGIDKPVIDNHSAYIDHWLQALKEHSDGDWIVNACRKAREAADYIISGGRLNESLNKAS